MGNVAKAVLVFREPFWEESLPAAGKAETRDIAFFHATDSRVAFPTWWTMLPVRTTALVGWAGGPPAERLAGLSEGRILAAAIRSLVRITGVKESALTTLLQASHIFEWRRDPFAQAYTTPLVIRVGDRDQVVSVGAFRAAAYDPQSGKEIWRVNYDDGFSNVPRPVYGHGLVYIVSGWTSPPRLLAVRPDGTGDVTKTHIAWTLRRGVPYIASPLLVGDELFVVNDNGILTCLDAQTGATHWQQRLGGNYSASPVFADGRIYFQSEEGVTTVIAPGREFRRLASNQLDGSMQASMAVAGGSLFIRTDTHLYRITAPR